MGVIVIGGILSAVALPQLNAAQDRAKDSVAKQEAIAAAKECSIYTLAGGTIPNGSQYIAVTIGKDLQMWFLPVPLAPLTKSP